MTAPNTGSIGYGYNANSQRTSLTYPDNSSIAYTHWDDGQLKDVLQGTTTLASYAYDPSGQLDTVTRANGAVTSYAYDGAGRLSDLSTLVGSTPVNTYHYTLNRQGLRTAVTETLTPVGTRAIAYSYDGLSRLTSAIESGATSNSYSYTYDLAGNRISATVNGVTTSQSYNAANQVVGWSYDAAGNLLNDSTTTYTYDALSRTLTQGGMSYSYNGDGVLVQAGAMHYAQDLASPLSQILNDGSATYLVYSTGERLGAITNGNRIWYVTDALGSVRQTLDDTGTPLATASYDPWGSPQGVSIAPFGFTGELQDQSDMVYLRARWYNPLTATFNSRDPFQGWIEQPQSLASYSYVHNDPVNWTDPTGRWRWQNASSKYHQDIEDAHLRRTRRPKDVHAEFNRLTRSDDPTIRTPVDLLHSDTGNVFEIEPIYNIAAGRAEVKDKTIRMELQSWRFKGRFRGEDYDWTDTRWHLGKRIFLIVPSCQHVTLSAAEGEAKSPGRDASLRSA